MSFRLADAIFWVAVACCSIAQLAILRSVIISPIRANRETPPTPARRAAEVAWAVLPGVALAVVLVFTWRTMHASRVALALSAAIVR
jgi:heme/copper-type cytochrome/quinol oxidase subunit 2